MNAPTRATELEEVIEERFGLDVCPVSAIQAHHAIDRLLKCFPTAGKRDLPEWVRAARNGDPDWCRIVDAITVGETCFFRDGTWPDVIAEQVLAPLVARRRAAGVLSIRLWSAGCATGEEAYTLAIMLSSLLPDIAAWSVTILATDLNRMALDRAREGLYREWSLRNTPQAIRDISFVRHSTALFELDEQIRRLVRFAPLNLATAGYPNSDIVDFDLIVCRNVLMYLTQRKQRQVARKLTDCLAREGYLSVTAAEASWELFPDLSPVLVDDTILLGKVGPPAAATRSPTIATRPSAMLTRSPTIPAPVAPTAANVGARLDGAASQLQFSEETGEARRHFAAARLLADQGDYQEARAACEAILVRHPLDCDGHMLHAQVCRHLDDPEAALMAVRRTLYLAPDHAEAWFLSAILNDQIGRSDRAQNSMRSLVSLLSGSAVAVNPQENPCEGSMVSVAQAWLQAGREGRKRR